MKESKFVQATSVEVLLNYRGNRSFKSLYLATDLTIVLLAIAPSKAA